MVRVVIVLGNGGNGGGGRGERMCKILLFLVRRKVSKLMSDAVDMDNDDTMIK